MAVIVTGLILGLSASAFAQGGGQGNGNQPAQPPAMTDAQADRYISDFIETCKADPAQCRNLGPAMREYLTSQRFQDCGTDETLCRAQRDRTQAALNEYKAHCQLGTNRCEAALESALTKRNERAQAKWCASRAGGCGK